MRVFEQRLQRGARTDLQHQRGIPSFFRIGAKPLEWRRRRDVRRGSGPGNALWSGDRLIGRVVGEYSITVPALLGSLWNRLTVRRSPITLGKIA